MDAFQLLKADHQKVAELFERLESARGERKLSVFNEIRTELELHAHIEEKIFYPAVEEPEETHDLALEAYEEHDVVKKLLKELSRAKRASDEWEAQAKVLQENVEHHVEEEENELFPKTAQVLSQEDIEDLGDRMAAEKARKQRGGSKSSSSKKSSSGKKSAAKKTASKATAGSRAAKRTSGTKKAASKKTSKSSGKKRSGSKKSSKKR